MSLGRQLPKSNPSCKNALNSATAKEASSAIGNTILSVATKDRLISMNDQFNVASTNVIVAEQAQRKASEDADINRSLSHTFISCYFSTFGNGIRLKQIPRNARAFYNLDINNDQMPDISRDVYMIECGQLIIDGDAKRVLGGGIAMAYPTIVDFKPVYNTYKSSITAFTTSKTNLHDAQTILNHLRIEAESVNLRVYNELEAYYSDLEMPARRAVCREWGEKFNSQGKPATIIGVVTDAEGLPISGVEFHLQGVGVKFISGIDGKYAVHTTLNGDLILLATSPLYKDNQTDLLMTDGGNMVINIVMETKV